MIAAITKIAGSKTIHSVATILDRRIGVFPVGVSVVAGRGVPEGAVPAVPIGAPIEPSTAAEED